jgi:hypothetical protein
VKHELGAFSRFHLTLACSVALAGPRDSNYKPSGNKHSYKQYRNHIKSHAHPLKMDRQTVYSLDLWGEQKSEVNDGQESNNAVQKKLVDFILSFAVDNAFVYRYAMRP